MEYNYELKNGVNVKIWNDEMPFIMNGKGKVVKQMYDTERKAFL